MRRRTTRAAAATLTPGDGRVVESFIESSRELDLAMELASLGRWEFNPATRRISFDDALLRVLRTTAAAQGGGSLLMEEYIRRYLPDDAQEVLKRAMDAAVAAKGTERTQQVEHRLRRADGTIAYVSVRFVVVTDMDGCVTRCAGVLQDISDRKKAEMTLTRLLEGESVLSSIAQRFIEARAEDLDGEMGAALRQIGELVGAVRTALFLYAPDGYVRNPYEWCLDPGDSLRDDVKDLKVGELTFFHEELSALRTVRVRAIDDLPAGTRERRYAERRGFRSMLLLPLTSHGRLIGVLAIYGRVGQVDGFDDELMPLLGSLAMLVSNVIARRTAEEERTFLERQLFQSQKLEAVGTLAGGIAHDFNNILTAIVGNLEIARCDAADGQPIDESLQAISTAAERATALVKQILAFSRHYQHERRVVSLPSLVAEAIRFARSTIPAVVAIEFTGGNDVPAVLADPTQIHQIVINLCANAWHAMESAHGAIEVHVDHVTLTEREALRIGGIKAGQCARLTVSDTGCGMNSEQVKRIFEPFFTTKPVGKGTGLGMSVVLGIVQGHGAGIRIDSVPGHGTTVSIYFPVACAAVREPEAAPRPVTGKGQHLLLLDDEAAVGQVMTRALERLGYKVSAFSNPDAAVAFLRNPAHRVEVAVSDYEMPMVTGLDVAREMLAVRHDLPIVLWSGRFGPDIEDAAREAGIRRLIAKPCEPRELSRVILEVLDAPQS